VGTDETGRGAPAAPLHGVRVVDLSRVLAGPYATMVLADLGADVVKVERPGAGDETRSWGPPFIGSESAYFISVNRSKRSFAVDVQHPEGREIVLDLCATADAVIENFRPGVAARLQLDETTVRQRNPRVVYCSITGFGDRQPADRAGYDFIVQAESGLMSITGTPAGPPMKVGVALLDVVAGLNAAVAMLAALRRREFSGEGEHVQVSLLDAALASLANVGQAALVEGREPPRWGNAHPSIVPYQPFHASDGLVAVGAANDRLFNRLCAVLGCAELAADPRFATNASRVGRREELVELLEPFFTSRTADEWVDVLTSAGVPAGKVRGVLDALRTANQTTVVAHPTAGDIELTAPPFQLSSASLAPVKSPPLLGEHTRAILSELGHSEPAIAQFEADGVVEQARGL
jgi:crotonobetainyl-CoA:carnitine CoA-transferase CaiB-like acyl-CoA transferase